MEKMNGLSLDIKKQNINKIKELFPEVVEDGKINFEMFKQVLGGEIDGSREKYQFTWNGKSKAIKLYQMPSSATLRPCKDKSKNWEDTENLYIEGDNLEVLKQLQKTYYGKIKMIYIDPPYNTGNDFVYNDSFSNSIENYKEQTDQIASSNPETNGRYHTDWLNMMYPRLVLASNLLSRDGVIFISIDDNEYSNILNLCNEIFGENNYCGTIPYRKRTMKNDVPFGISQDYEWVLVYAKSSSFFAGVPVVRKYYSSPDYPNDRWRLSDLTTQKIESQRPNSAFNLIDPKTGKEYKYNPKRLWAITKDTFQEYYDKGKIVFPDDYEFLNISIPAYRVFESEDKEKAMKLYGVDTPLKSFSTVLSSDVGMNEQGTKEVDGLIGNKVFSFPKPTSLIRQFLLSIHNKDAIILDFFSGSATTAHAVMKLNAEDGGNRKFIMVQLPELCDEKSEAYKAGYKNICDIGEERIRRAGELIKSEWAKEHPSDGLFSSEEKFTTDIGFKVFKLDSTNIVPWDSSAEYDEENLFNLSDVFKNDRSKEDILYEIMLKYGVFDRSVEEIDVNGKTMYRVGKRYMIVCLEDDVTSEDVKSIGELSPKTVIFKESGFNNDNDKINASYNLSKLGVEDIKCI